MRSICPQKLCTCGASTKGALLTLPYQLLGVQEAKKMQVTEILEMLRSANIVIIPGTNAADFSIEYPGLCRNTLKTILARTRHYMADPQNDSAQYYY